jgi:hypothetical protein
MRVDHAQLDLAARRQRAQAIAALMATAIAWIVSHAQRTRHAARPHFAR